MIMELSLLIAFKRVLGGIIAVLLIAGISKSKSSYRIDTIRKHINSEIKKNPKAQRVYGNDVEAYISQNYPDNESFINLVIINAFRPLLVLILISVFDFQNSLIVLFEIIVIILIFPIEIYFGDKWKNKKWYILVVLFLWFVAFVTIAYSNFLQLNNKNVTESNTNPIKSESIVGNDTITH
jgi:hypothetical protein